MKDRNKKGLGLVFLGISMLTVSSLAFSAGDDFSSVASTVSTNLIAARKLALVIAGVVGVIAVIKGIFKLINRSPQDEIGKTIVLPIVGGIALLSATWLIGIGAKSIGSDLNDTNSLGNTYSYSSSGS